MVNVDGKHFIVHKKMVKFSLSSKYLENLRSVVGKFETYKEHKCSIVVNKTFTIEVPVVVAASISSSITKIIENDPTASTFPFTIKHYNESSMQKIKQVIARNASVSIGEEDEEDMQAFAEFGLSIGNEDFVSPLNKQLEKESSSITEGNVVRILSLKNTFNNKNTGKETTFIAENFDSMSTNESFIEFSKCVSNIRTVEEIIRSDKLKMNNEDTLMTFLLNICAKNEERNRFIHLFEHVLLEYCSIETCRKFLLFVEETLPSDNMKPLISCIGRRILQPKIPVDPENENRNIKARHKQEIVEGKEISIEDPLNGILRREYQKGNLIINASSTSNGSVYNVINEENTDFMSQDEQNSFIKASLREGKTFKLKKYMIRGNSQEGNKYKMNSWKLEGKNAANNEWFVLDEQSNVSFNKLEVKTFDVKCNERLKTVRLTQTGTNGSGDYQLRINAFDIFGTLYE